MQNNENRTPNKNYANRPHGPRGMIKEKPKDFKSAFTRLLKELSGFKVLILLSLTLAILGSILSILAPNKLSDLTDEISNGLIINKDNMEDLTKNITDNLSEEKLKNVIPNILDIQMDQNTILQIMANNEIPASDKQAFQNILDNMNNGNNDSMSSFRDIPQSILNVILKDSEYDGVVVTKDDKLKLIDTMGNINKENMNFDLPKSIQSILFDEIEIDGVKVSIDDQVKFLELASTLDDSDDVNTLYGKIDDAPKNIKKLVEPVMNMNKIKNIALFLACLYILSALFTYIQSIAMTKVSNNFARGLRNRISVKINKLPLKYFDRNPIGDTLSRVTNDVDMIAMTMNQSLATLVSSITLFLGTIIMMFITNYIMAITAIISSLLGFIFMFIILGRSQKYFKSRQKELGKLNGHIEEIYSGLNVVKAYNGKKDADEKFDKYNKKVYEANRKSQFLSGLMMPMMNFIGNLGYVAVCVVGALLTMNDVISFGVIIAFITYVRLFTSPLSQIAQAMTSMQSTMAASERVFEFVDQEEMASQDNITKSINKNKVKGNIEFKNIEFKYDGNDKPTIKNFSATVKQGQKIAIVGPTGAGKTTMVNLLMKFYDINKGDIIIDGISIKDLTRENIHKLFTMVLQDTWLFSGTIKENIIYNRKNISDKRVHEVCKIVGLDHFIKTLPKGYDSIIADNDSVSAGQRQLLTIARGMIEDAPFLILDEATSNVDTRTEELVQEAMDKLTLGKTSFIIAHRLSTIKNADLILVMKDGNIIETGNHDELMKQNGFYADLYNSQFEI